MLQEIDLITKASKTLSYNDSFGCVKTAVRKAAIYFDIKGNDRGKVIMPCGSGKTLFSCFLTMRELKPQRTIITVPNLLLEEQTFKVFYSQLKNDGYEFICIGSSKDLAQGLGQKILVTTSSDEIIEFLTKNVDKKVIVMATYQSMGAVCYSCSEIGFKFNLGIIDEAHRTAGKEGKPFSKVLFDENIHIDKRLFLTATERTYNGKDDEITGMNNPKHYGDTIYNYPLEDAIKYGILCDYEINEMYSTDDEVFSFIKSNSYLNYEEIDLTDKEKKSLLCALIATIRAIKEKGCKKIVTYQSTVKKAIILKQLLEKIISNNMLDMGVFHVNGINQSIGERMKNMNEFQSSFISVLTNSQALVEGIDIPCIDGIVFADKKENAVQIVQAVGRALRKHTGKNKCYIIVPIITSSKKDFSVNNTDFSGLFSILMQMAMQDNRLLHEIRQITEGESNVSSNKIWQSNIKLDNIFREDLLRLNKNIRLRIVERFAEWMSYEEAEKFVISHKFKTIKEWLNYRKSGNKPSNLPGCPEFVYKDKGWVSFGKFLGTGHEKNTTFRPFKDAHDFVLPHKFKDTIDWKKYCASGEKPKDIPSNPNIAYKGKGWQGWKHFLGEAFDGIQRVWQPYKNAKKLVLENNIKCHEEWKKFSKTNKKPKDIPVTVDRVYKNKGWKSWGEFFGTGRGYRKVDCRSFDSSRKFVSKFKFKNCNEWRKYCKSGKKPKDIPSNPNTIYKDKGWTSFSHFFGFKK